MKIDQRFAAGTAHKLALTKAVKWIKKNLEPEEVFSKKQLKRWAKENGFSKPK